jgi:S-adenosylmethionine uptake transporter
MNKKYLLGISFFILSLLSSLGNDIIQKYLGSRLHSFEITFFRNSIAALSLVPFILYYGRSSIKTDHIYIQFFRGLLLFLGISAWIFGLKIVKISAATVFGSTVPLFTLILALFFLPEKIIWQRWVATIAGLIGTYIVMNPHGEDFNYGVLIFIFSSICFASLDIINKKFVTRESIIGMLFYSAFFTAILSSYPAISQWVMPNMHELGLLFILGISGNLILYFILKAFSLVDATATAPYRYLEFCLSALAGYLIFNEIPDKNIVLGAIIVIPSTLFVVFAESRNNKKNM